MLTPTRCSEKAGDPLLGRGQIGHQRVGHRIEEGPQGGISDDQGAQQPTDPRIETAT